MDYLTYPFLQNEDALTSSLARLALEVRTMRGTMNTMQDRLQHVYDHVGLSSNSTTASRPFTREVSGTPILEAPHLGASNFGTQPSSHNTSGTSQRPAMTANLQASQRATVPARRRVIIQAAPSRSNSSPYTGPSFSRHTTPTGATSGNMEVRSHPQAHRTIRSATTHLSRADRNVLCVSDKYCSDMHMVS